MQRRTKLRGYAAHKTALRVEIVDRIMECLKGEQIFNTLDYRRRSESYLKQYMHQPLQACLVDVVGRIDDRLSQEAREARAKAALFWEGDMGTTVNNVLFLGVQHRPDFAVKLAGIRIAVEVKKGETGGAVRGGIGQSLVYVASKDFDFVVYLFADTSRDKKIRDAAEGSAAAKFIESLWDNYNVRFSVV